MEKLRRLPDGAVNSLVKMPLGLGILPLAVTASDRQLQELRAKADTALVDAIYPIPIGMTDPDAIATDMRLREGYRAGLRATLEQRREIPVPGATIFHRAKVAYGIVRSNSYAEAFYWLRHHT